MIYEANIVETSWPVTLVEDGWDFQSDLCACRCQYFEGGSCVLLVNADAFPSLWHHGNMDRVALLDCSFRLEGLGDFFECGFQIAASKHGCMHPRQN